MRHMHFRVAPWPTLLKAVSAGSCVVLLVVAWLAAHATPRAGVAHWVGSAVAWIPVAVLLGALLFVVTDYELDDRRLAVRRLLWWTRVDLTGLTRVFRGLVARFRKRWDVFIHRHLLQQGSRTVPAICDRPQSFRRDGSLRSDSRRQPCRSRGVHSRHS